jgi:hypothetical protein
MPPSKNESKKPPKKTFLKLKQKEGLSRHQAMQAWLALK